MTTLSAKEAARELGTDARTFRKFMRSMLPKEEQPGQGNRYHIEEAQLKKLKSQFEEWSKPKAKAKVIEQVIEVDEDQQLAEALENLDEFDFEDEEPTAEDLEELEGLEDALYDELVDD